MDPKIFISFSGEEEELANALVQLLKEGADFRESSIFSFRKPGNLPPGCDFIPVIREKIASSDYVIFLITKNYLKSYFCLAELGAAWALEKKCLSIVEDPRLIQALNQTPMLGKQAITIYDTLGLSAWLNKDLNSWQMAHFQQCAEQYRAKLERIYRFCRADKQGIYHAEIKSVFFRYSHRFYRLDRLIDLEQISANIPVTQFDHHYFPDESHWIADWGGQFAERKKGDLISFRILEISEAGDRGHVNHARNIKAASLEPENK